MTEPAAVSPDKDDSAVERAWARALRNPPQPGIAFYPARRDGPAAARCVVVGLALYEPDLSPVYLCRADGDAYLLACPAAYWPDFLAGRNPPEPAALDRAREQLDRRAPDPGTPFLHYKGGRYLAREDAVLLGTEPQPAVLYCRADRPDRAWLRTLDEWSMPVDVPGVGLLPRFRPERT